MPLDTSSAEANIRTFVKIRASLEPVDVVTWFRGGVYAFLPGEGHKHLFTLEGYNIGRAVETEGGYDFLSREAVFYRDPVTDEFIDSWTNPITGETNDVLHIWNDPVNGGFKLNGPRGPWTLVPDVWGDDVHFSTDVFLLYPNPLQPDAWPRESGGPMYQGAELFRPWMLMGTRAGHLVYHTGGKKLMGGYAELPADTRAKVEAERPEYMFAPATMVTPNETSWTFYAKQRRPAK
jgi:Protein of unknown function (DUF1838)